ncbi:Fatty acyl-CoA reductase [Methyloligella halotolerans]|uniref:Fatty acyl-CoA reductase n=1 Tax=Methyloligella halotolerans TaxID=1177755 RepID=A0A1E2RZC6_9HYPH|nr:SDR family NAD(P)-dependent oxidoreductase [Methyloligella halotolerans]ODA67587.1 Fatty acyl-CoA reductase [Methyloligella halotolerans]
MSEKLALITGASSGIGAETARQLAAKGHRCLLLARDRQRLETVAEEIRKTGGRADVYPVDLADDRAVQRAADALLEEAGVPDLVINNAGAGRWRPFLETSTEEAVKMIAVPYFASVYLTRALLPAMVDRGSGRLAFVASPGAYFAWPNASTYIAARHAVKGFAEALRTELKPQGIGVSLIVLGTVESAYWEHNPGSRENLPETDERLLPTLSLAEAAEAIVEGVEAGKPVIVKPALYKALFLLNAIAPGLVASQIRKASKKAWKRA